MLQRLPMLLIGALLVIGGVLAASPGFAATGKYCSPTADNIVVYIDRTTNYDDKDKKDLVDGVSKLFASLQGGERFSIRTISDSFTTSTSLIDDCVPVCASKGFLGDLFSSDCTEGVAINDKNHLRNRLVQQLEGLLNSYSDLPYSDIVRTIAQTAGSELRKGQRNRFFLFTDLIENSDYLPGKEFFSTRNDKLLAKLTTDRLIPDLDGAEVVAFGVGRSGAPGRPPLQQALLSKLLDFWHQYFAAAHASFTTQVALGGL